MKELADILAAWRDQPASAAALATVAQTEGSSYRRPGARMLVLDCGRPIGSISGGCVETDVIEKAATVKASGVPLVLTYDTSTEEDIVFGAGLGCSGLVRVLLEPVRPPFMDFLQRVWTTRQSGAVATIFKVEGETSAPIGARVILEECDAVWSDIAHAGLRETLTADAREALRSGRQNQVRHAIGPGAIEAFVEIVRGPAPLVIFGAGYDAFPLARMARELGYHVTIVDARPAYADAKRFPEADAIVLARAGEWNGQLSLTDQTAAVVMSHHYLTDAATLKALASLPLRYLGVMGPRRRAEKMAAELGPEGQEVLRRAHNPIGLDIGADSPEQIALAILAEIQAAGAGRPGGPLRDRQGPIHAAHGTA
jgi:xanthine/CO dehydrogenase XdhC/CoxF family maturation factor